MQKFLIGVISVDFFFHQGPSPHVVLAAGESEGRLVIEEKNICSTEGVLEAFVVLFSVFYIFNIEYPKYAKNTLIFIQKYIIQLKDKYKTPSKVSALMLKLNSLME